MKPRSFERQLEVLEASYRELLLYELRLCATGAWGLFGHNDLAINRLGPVMTKRINRPEIDKLLELGSNIERLRSKLGHLESFPLHERLLLLRSSHDANTPGEPKLAQQWLDEMQA